ncbi:DinB family protein [Jannaschia pohangensis]|uniref:Uncharacterized damage-inducible protein DinB (Forms a four-helix bundle) n=1 Tax=Jannaschia pohangensis TaxID=390807 RepID=A0A1I3HGB3_9RHOB|nr:DinB family protein [Jannaschia pohangensis]SFI34744.1 Uncharacterized damage-inducible protein DinB (forms a four-helix bundle) [Jannaschia pohangensis]
MSRALAQVRLAARNNAWANATFLAALSALPDGAFAAPRPGFFPSLSQTLNHIHVVDLFYLDVLTEGGRGRAVFDAPDILDPGALADRQAEADAALVAFCDTLTEETLDQTRQIARRDGPVREQVGEILPHLFQHQIHHRGQAHVQLHHAGIAPPQLDEFYMTQGRIASVRAIRGDG